MGGRSQIATVQFKFEVLKQVIVYYKYEFLEKINVDPMLFTCIVQC